MVGMRYVAWECALIDVRIDCCGASNFTEARDC